MNMPALLSYEGSIPYCDTRYASELRPGLHIVPDGWRHIACTPLYLPSDALCDTRTLVENRAPTSEQLRDFLAEKEELLARARLEGGLTLHCVSPLPAAAAAQLLREGVPVRIVLPDLNAPLLRRIFSERSEQGLSDHLPLPAPGTLLHYFSLEEMRHDCAAHPDLRLYAPLRPLSDPTRHPLSFGAMRIYWEKTGNTEALLAADVLRPLFADRFTPEEAFALLHRCRNNAAELARLPEGHALLALRGAAPYHPAQTGCIDALERGLEDYLSGAPYAAKEESEAHSFYELLSETEGRIHLTMLTDQAMTAVYPAQSPEEAADPVLRAYANALRLQGDVLLSVLRTRREQIVQCSMSDYADGAPGTPYAPLLSFTQQKSAPEPVNPSGRACAAEPGVIPAVSYDRCAAMRFFLCPYRYMLEDMLALHPHLRERSALEALREVCLIVWLWRVTEGRSVDPEQDAPFRERAEELAASVGQYLPFRDAMERTACVERALQYLFRSLTERNAVRPYAPSHAQMLLQFGGAVFFENAALAGEHPVFAPLIRRGPHELRRSLHALPKTDSPALTAEMQSVLAVGARPTPGAHCVLCPIRPYCSVGAQD